MSDAELDRDLYSRIAKMIDPKAFEPSWWWTPDYARARKLDAQSRAINIVSIIRMREMSGRRANLRDGTARPSKTFRI